MPWDGDRRGAWEEEGAVTGNAGTELMATRSRSVCKRAETLSSGNFLLIIKSVPIKLYNIKL